MDKIIGLETAKVIILEELKRDEAPGSNIDRILLRLQEEIDAENDAVEKEFCGE